MANILITDDTMFMRKMLGDILRKAGHTVVEAGNGIECVEILKKQDFDLVTLDITMPEMDGLAALKEIKSFKPNQKVIMVSAMGQQVMVVDAVKSGASDFIVKPYDKDKLLESVSRVLSK